MIPPQQKVICPKSWTWKKKWCIYFILYEFNLGHNIVPWQFSVTCYQDKTWDMRHISWSLNHQIPFFSKKLDTFLCQKTFCSKGKVETAFKDFLSLKSLEFYCTGINDLVNPWQKCVDVQGLYLDWLKHCLNSLIQVYSEIGLYFPNYLIFWHRVINITNFLGTIEIFYCVIDFVATLFKFIHSGFKFYSKIQ